MKEIPMYKCDICGESFNDKTEAEQHELKHSMCICQGGFIPEKHRIYNILGYGEDQKVYVDFTIPAIVLEYELDRGRVYDYSEQKLPISFCPFCGRDLKDKGDNV